MSTQSGAKAEAGRIVAGLDQVTTTAAVVFWIFVLYWSSTQVVSKIQYGVLFVGAIMTVYALHETQAALAEGDWVDGLVLLPASISLIAASVYFATNFEAVYLMRQGFALDHEYMLARMVLVSLFYLTWREFGNLFLGLVVGVVLYAMYGDVVPGVLGHAGMGEATLLQVTVTDLYGFYGSLTQLMASWIAPFLLYAGLLFAYGAFDLILRVAIVASKFIRSGVAQTAVLSSAVIGSINGSYTANVAMTGSFTIPTMIESGMQRHKAAGIESVASTSGQVLPPVMGASAFVMASYLGVPYISIVIAGLIPAAVLVVSIAVAVHYTAIADDSSQGMEFDDYFDLELSREQKIFEGLRFGIPFIVLIYFLGIAQYTIMTSALFTVYSMLATGILMPMAQRVVDGSETGPLREGVVQLRKTVSGLREGAITLAPIAIILIVISGVVNIFSTTGVPAKIALLMIGISGGVLLFAVLLGMAVAIVMGIGMPTVAAYVIVAILIVPTFVSDFGIAALTAHYTVFYAAILAGITPPVATAAVVASGIAGANFWRTCGSAIRIAAPLFVLPIAFVYNPELIAFELNLVTAYVGLLVILGAVTMIYGLNYPFQLGRTGTLLARTVLVTLGILIMTVPDDLLKIVGIVAFAGVFIGEKMMMGAGVREGRGMSE
jgi:TRAP transporter, 4TM/12TM fusion protein